MFYLYQLLQYLISPFYKCFQPGFNRGIWVHASSVGEVNASSGLIMKLRQHYHDIPILLTVFTESGVRHALKIFEHDRMVEVKRFPGDYVPCLSSILEGFKPVVLVLVETEIWPNLIFQAKRKSIPVVMVNARLSEKYRRYKIFGMAFTSLINRIDRILAVNEYEATKFKRLGVSQNKIEVIGNLKFDFSARLPESKEPIIRKDPKRPIVTFGSIRSREEPLVIHAVLKIIKNGARVVIAPRHLDRVRPIYESLKRDGIKIGLRTVNIEGDWDVLLLDTIGELLDFYAISDIGFVGGTLAPYGGHNLIEPAVFGIPVIFGPYIANVKDIAQGLIDNQGGLMVKSTEELANKIIYLLSHTQVRKFMGDRAEEFVRKNLNIADTVVKKLAGYIENAG